MKKLFKNPYFIIFILSIIVMIPMILNFRYVGHDAEFHIVNIKNITDNLSWHNIFALKPLFGIANNFAYGTRFFYPPLPHLMCSYILKILQIFNINNVLIIIRLTDFLVIFISGIVFYKLLFKLFQNKKIGILGAFFYMSMPYHLAEIYIRDALAEMFIFISLPLIVLGLLELKDKNYKKFYLYFTIGYTISVYSHMAVSIYLTIILLLTFFPVYFKEIFNLKSLKYLFLSCTSILLLTSPFYLTMMEMKESCQYAIFVPYYLTGKGDLQYSTLHFIDYFNFLLPHNYSFIRYHLNLSVTILLFVSLIYIIKHKLIKDKSILFLILMLLLSIIMSTNIFPWKYIPDFLAKLQFPWRLTLFVSSLGVIVSLIFLSKLSSNKNFNKIFVILMFICTIELFYNTYHTDKTLDINNISESYGMGNQAEYLPYNASINIDYYNNRSHDIIASSDEIINIIENSKEKLVFDANIEDEVTIELPRLYYKGYELTINDKKINLTESDKGFLESTINESGRYELIYKGTKLMKISYILAFITLILNIYFFKSYDIIKTRK